MDIVAITVETTIVKGNLMGVIPRIMGTARIMLNVPLGRTHKEKSVDLIADFSWESEEALMDIC